MNKKITSALIISSLLLLLCSFKSQAQPVMVKSKYWIKFKDKTGTPYSLSNPGAFLTAKSINRRTYYNIPYHYTDLPVTPAYPATIASIPNVTVMYTSRWMNGVVVSIYDSLAAPILGLINSFPFVTGSNEVYKYRLTGLEQMPAPLNQENLRTASTSSYNMGNSAAQIQQLEADCLHNLGFRGKGMTIAVLDVGFRNVDVNSLFDSLRARGGILGTRNFVNGGTGVYQSPDHGAGVLSCMAAIIPGLIMGTAPMADYWLLRTEDDAAETLSEEYNWIRGAEFADSVGVDILTTSLGYTQFDNGMNDHNYATLNGRTAPMSIAANLAARKGMLVFNAAGNEGDNSWHYISVPGDADSICTVGAVDVNGNLAYFSSVGPTADGRIKPDLCARGLSAWIGDGNGSLSGQNGTSFATPILAGAAACLWQQRMQPNVNNIKVIEIMKSSATNRASPNNNVGWGIPKLCSVPVGIQENSSAAAAFKLSVSPNPFNDVITINLTQNHSGALSAELTDVLGKTIRTVNTGNTGDNNISLNTGGLNEGVYFVKVSTAEGTVTKKIIKQQ